MRFTTALAVIASFTIAGTAAQAAPAGAFLRDAGMGDRGEVQLGRLAMQRASSRGVRDYGQRLVRDHGNHLVQVRSLARSMRVGIPTTLKPDARNAYNRLSRMRGGAFDRMFVQHMIEDHRHDIAAYEEQARSGDRRTAALARQTLPTLRAHLRIAESLAR